MDFGYIVLFLSSIGFIFSRSAVAGSVFSFFVGMELMERWVLFLTPEPGAALEPYSFYTIVLCFFLLQYLTRYGDMRSPNIAPLCWTVGILMLYSLGVIMENPDINFFGRSHLIAMRGIALIMLALGMMDAYRYGLSISNCRRFGLLSRRHTGVDSQ